MRKLALFTLLLRAFFGTLLCAQATAPSQEPEVLILDRLHAQEWSSDIDRGWRTHGGDDPAWASPTFDDSTWQQVRLDNLGASKPGWRWFRQHIKLSEHHPDLTLLVQGGTGVYALYINGSQVPGPQLQSSFTVNRPIERTLPLSVPGSRVDIALRTFAPAGYSSWRLPLFMTAAIGTEDAIETQRQAMESSRLYLLIPAVAINLLLALAGIGAIVLHRSQPNHFEYLWLGAYLLLDGFADLLWYSQAAGYLPLAANFLVSDPLLYWVTIAQIEFTFSFGGRSPHVLWRIYESLLLAAPVLAWLTWFGQLPSAAYMVIEPLLLVPAALLLPIMLFTWYRRGNRDAGWLILPSLLPAATMSLYDFGTLSIFFGWQHF